MRWEHSTERKRKRKYETEVKRHREQRERSLTEATKGKKRQNGEKTMFEENGTEDSTKVMQHINLQIQETQQVPNRINMKFHRTWKLKRS